MKASTLQILIYSPQWTSKLLHYFLSGVKLKSKKGIKFELIYFVLPFVFDRSIRNKLKSSNINSTFSTLFNHVELKKQLLLKDEEILNFKEITNSGFIYLGNKIKVDISDYLDIEETVMYQNEKNSQIRDYYKSAYMLGIIFAKEDYLDVFMKVGVTKL